MPDYMFLLESRLSPEQRAAFERVQELSRMLQVNVYLTGGAVRDLISGQNIRDLDFTVEGNPVRMVRELEKGGARIIWESEKLRHYELTFAGDADGSISAARDDVYESPGAKPDYHFGGIMEDLRRRDFSINAIAISLNAQSRGLLLDPTNGLADLERQEVRALSIHAFTNQPVRLLRALRYCARMGFKMESRTQEWFELAMERGLEKTMENADVGQELRAVSREENPVATLKQWEARDLLAAIHPQLQRRKPDYDSLNKLNRIRSNYVGVGLRPRLRYAVTNYILGRLKGREGVSILKRMEFRKAEMEAAANLLPEAQKVVKHLKGRKTNAPRDAYAFLASLPAEMLVFIEVELPNPRALSKIRNYVQKWRPLRMGLPTAELDALGVPRGAKFDKIIEQIFDLQLRGKARTPELQTKALRNLAGIRDEVPKKIEKKKSGKGDPVETAPATAQPGASKPGGAYGKGAASTAAPAAAPAKFQKGSAPAPKPAPKSKTPPAKGSRGH